MGDRIHKTNKRYSCGECKQDFARRDHLSRHLLLHSGVRPYCCTFCQELFARCDSLRRHYAGCPKRGDRQIPQTDHKGRRRHACQPCSAMKLRCEGDVPCKSCLRRAIPCIKAVSAKSGEEQSKSPSSDLVPSPATSQVVEPGSIKFLLNAGEAGFIADWRMPDGSDAPRASISRPSQEPQSNHVGQSVANYHFDPATSDLLQAFERGPWTTYRQHWQDDSAPEDSTIIWPLGKSEERIWTGTDYDNDGGLDDVVASALINVLTLAMSRLNLDIKTQQDLTADITFLMTPERISRFIESYKSIWHLNCPIVHIANLAPENVQLALLVSIVLMGAMYSANERELAAAKGLLDIAEIFCFSSDVLSPENEMRRCIEGEGKYKGTSDWAEFQQFQGAYLMVATQFWAGNQPARSRAMECRFSEIIKVIRAMGLHKATHTAQDKYNQELWIRNECKIRTMSILFCLDCAFLFFRSYPCRLVFTELEFELPCEEPVFNSRNPFQHARFGRRSPVTLKQAVEALSKPDPSTGENTTTRDASRLTMLSMFILIHMLYAFISNRLSLPWLNNAPRGQDGVTPGGDSFLAKINKALDRWAELWEEALADTSEEAWKMAGLFRNGNKYHMVAQLLVQKHEVIEGDELMVPMCEDKWARMRALT